nr:unnamed protein product [Callosobruchus chinensis]
MANDIRDIKNSQTQLSTDVAHCRALLQQHSDTIARHHDSIISCEASIQQLQNTQASLSCTIANINRGLPVQFQMQKYLLLVLPITLPPKQKH